MTTTWNNVGPGACCCGTPPPPPPACYCPEDTPPTTIYATITAASGVNECCNITTATFPLTYTTSLHMDCGGGSFDETGWQGTFSTSNVCTFFTNTGESGLCPGDPAPPTCGGPFVIPTPCRFTVQLDACFQSFRLIYFAECCVPTQYPFCGGDPSIFEMGISAFGPFPICFAINPPVTLVYKDCHPPTPQALGLDVAATLPFSISPGDNSLPPPNAPWPYACGYHVSGVKWISNKFPGCCGGVEFDYGPCCTTLTIHL